MCLNWRVGSTKNTIKIFQERLEWFFFSQSLRITTHNYYANSPYSLQKKKKKKMKNDKKK